MSTFYWILVCLGCFAFGFLGGFQLFKYLASRAIMMALKSFAIDLNNKNQGFTLVELLICLSVMALVGLLIFVVGVIVFVHH